MENIAHKIKQLLKLAERTTFPEEAANAAGKAQALMDKYKISLGALNTVEKESIQIFKDSPLNEDENSKRLSGWKWRLADVLNKANGTYAYCSGPQIICVGTPSNVDTVRYLYSYCINQINRLTAELCRGQGRTYSNNFRIGCVDAIAEAIRKEKACTEHEVRKEAKSPNELAVINNSIIAMKQETDNARRFCQATIRIRSSSMGGSRSDSNARAAGQQAGASIYNGQRGRLAGSNYRLN